MNLYPTVDPNAQNDVLIGYAHNGNVGARFMDSVLAAFAEDQRRAARGKHRRLVEYHGAQGPYIHDNRSRIARYFLEATDKQWLWMLDNDMDFPIDSLYRLLGAAERHDARILGAAYWNQYDATNIYLSWLLFTEKGIAAMRALPDEVTPVEVTAVGMGCTLIHRSVLQDVADSYPNDPWDTYAADMLVQFEDGGFLIGRTPDDFEGADQWDKPGGRQVVGAQRMGEDVTFCLRARRVGFKTYGLPTLVAEHYKQHLVAHGRGDGFEAKELEGAVR